MQKKKPLLYCPCAKCTNKPIPVNQYPCVKCSVENWNQFKPCKDIEERFGQKEVKAKEIKKFSFNDMKVNV